VRTNVPPAVQEGERSRTQDLKPRKKQRVPGRPSRHLGPRMQAGEPSNKLWFQEKFHERSPRCEYDREENRGKENRNSRGRKMVKSSNLSETQVETQNRTCRKVQRTQAGRCSSAETKRQEIPEKTHPGEKRPQSRQSRTTKTQCSEQNPGRQNAAAGRFHGRNEVEAAESPRGDLFQAERTHSKR